MLHPKVLCNCLDFLYAVVFNCLPQTPPIKVSSNIVEKNEASRKQTWLTDKITVVVARSLQTVTVRD